MQRPPQRPTRAIGLLALAITPSAAPVDDSDEEKAQAQLEKAELRYEQTRYSEAVTYYRRLAIRFPDTAAGRIAAERSRPTAYLGSKLIVDNGPSENRIDVALMGDGYTLEHQGAFDALAEDIPPLFERQRTFREYFSYFNFRRFNLVSKDDMVDGFGREEDTALNGHTIGTIQGHVSIDGSLVRAMLDEAPPHDGLAIAFVRVGVLGTGGSGVATIGGRSARTTIHEWGHAFAHLGDEYSSKTHDRGGVSERVNVTATDDPQKVPWAHWIEAGVPGIGVYEGASGQVRGAWKPTSSGCVMESGEFFCGPCREALVLRIYSLVDPIDAAQPPANPRAGRESLPVEDDLELEVTVLQPEKHDIEVRWWVFPELRAPQDPRSRDARYSGRFRDRRSRGPLAAIQDEPAKETRADRHGVHSFRVKAKDLEPGRYRVVCRARDATKMRGDRHPWVLRDEHGVLESERAWWIVVRPEDGDGDEAGGESR